MFSYIYRLAWVITLCALNLLGFLALEVDAGVLNIQPIAKASLENKSYDIQVKLRDSSKWMKLPAYKAKVRSETFAQSDAALALLETDGAIDVRITKIRGNIGQVVIRPLNLKIKAKKIKSNRVEFAMKKPSYVSIEIDGGLYDNIHFFADQPEESPILGPAKNVIYFGPGYHLVKEPIVLKNNQTLYLAAGAYVLFDEDFSDRPSQKGHKGIFEKFPGIRILAKNINDVTIRGRGIISMIGPEFSSLGGNTGDPDQVVESHRGIIFDRCNNVLVDGITYLKSSRGWPNTLSYSKGLTYQNFKMIGSGQNCDGIDINGCEDVVVKDSFIRSADDSITVKSFGDNGANKNHLYANLTVWNDEANHPLIVGGETRGQYFKNISFDNIDIINFNSPGCLGGAMGISAHDNAFISDITFNNIRVERMRNKRSRLMKVQVVYNKRWTRTPNTAEYRGRVRDVTFKNISSHVFRSSALKGYDKDHTVENVVFENIKIKGKKISNKQGLKLDVKPFVKNVVIK
ncbi:MAG: hypothetical protein HQL32_09785 [Planctomycetes bacterium]|nr:hypothetical protein [Planctomycetota bacterium]